MSELLPMLNVPAGMSTVFIRGLFGAAAEADSAITVIIGNINLRILMFFTLCKQNYAF
jgi:hypothetical protein